ncbi:MAG: carbohydrate binding domain-containing protein [Candidatus Omnitrophota bacterium]
MRRSFFVLSALALSLVAIGCSQKKPSAPAPEPAAPIEVPKPEVREEIPEVVCEEVRKEIIIADFDSGAKPNNIGGDFGSWDKDPGDTTQGASMAFNPDQKYGKDGFCLELDYDVDTQNPAYNGFWMKLKDIDASAYDKLVMYIKGDDVKGYPQKVKIELKNARGETGKAYITQISGTWAPIEVPFSSFQGINDFSDLTEFTVVFEDSVSRPKTGTIYLDNIGFARD